MHLQRTSSDFALGITYPSAVMDMDVEQQARMIAALQSADHFPHPSGRFVLIETHISFVLLTGHYAYKFKKPIDLGFLNFTTLEKRRFYCHEELRLNRRLAPELYEAVVPITGTLAAPILDGSGPPIDYAVRMHQFSENDRLDHVTDRGELTAEHIDQLSTAIAAFHRNAVIASKDTLFGTPANIGDHVQQNFDQIMGNCDEPDVCERLEPLHEWSVNQLRELHEDLELRRREGWIRECHGDMHLANMALIKNRVRIFDALEFADDLRWIDPLSEVAFLYMDLEHRGHLDLARRFLSDYLEAADDYQGLSLLRYYLVYRAMVRAKVAAIEARQHIKDSAHHSDAIERMNSYIALAERYRTASVQAPMIVLHGLSGSGKSTLSRQLVEAIGAVRLRSDVERKRLLGLAPEECTASNINTGAYTPDVTEKTYQRLLALSYPIVDAGLPVIVDATSLRRAQRTPFLKLAAAAGTRCIIVDIMAPESILRDRITHRHKKERDASEATLAVLEHQLRIAEPLTVEEEQHTIHVDSSKPFDVAALADAILASVASP